MSAAGGPVKPEDLREARPVWPTVSPGFIRIEEWDWDPHYMGVDLRLEICNRSPYLVREAELRVNGTGPGDPAAGVRGGLVASRTIKVGPLFPGVYVHEDIGLGAQGGITGVGFDPVAARAVPLAPPDELLPAAEYPGLSAEVLEVVAEVEVPDLREPDGASREGGASAEAALIRVRVVNGGPSVIDRVRLKVAYLGAGGGPAEGPAASPPSPVAEWILDMPRADWNPYRVADGPGAGYAVADPLPPGRAQEFTIVHYGRGPVEWAARLEATAVTVEGIRVVGGRPM